jgi:hypothetical protein
MPQLNKALPYICFLLFGLLLFAMSKCSQARNEQQEAQFNTERLLTEQEQYIQDAQGRTTTVKESLILQAKEFDRIKGIKDEQIFKLQQAVKDAGKGVRAAAVFTAVTKGKAVGRTDSVRYISPEKQVFPSDTVPKKLPVYYGTVSAPGLTASIQADQDSMKLLNYELKQDYTVAFTDQKKKGLFAGLFSKPKKVVQIKALNTGSRVEDVRSFEVPDPKPKRGLFFGAGAAAAVLLLLL